MTVERALLPKGPSSPWGVLKEVWQQHLTAENLKKAEVISFSEKQVKRVRGIKVGFACPSFSIKRKRDFFPVSEYPEGVKLLENEFGARITFDNKGNPALIRYTEPE